MKAKITTPFPSNFTCTIRIVHDERAGFRGTLLHKEVGIKDYKTDLEPDETNQILSIVTRASNGDLVFDPPPQNLLKLWKTGLEKAKEQEQQDAAVLDKQEARITELESELTKAREAHSAELVKTRETFENELTAIRDTHAAEILTVKNELTKTREAHEIEINAAKRASENAVGRIKELTEELKAERAKRVLETPEPEETPAEPSVETPEETPAEPSVETKPENPIPQEASDV